MSAEATGEGHFTFKLFQRILIDWNKSQVSGVIKMFHGETLWTIFSKNSLSLSLLDVWIRFDCFSNLSGNGLDAVIFEQLYAYSGHYSIFTKWGGVQNGPPHLLAVLWNKNLFERKSFFFQATLQCLKQIIRGVFRILSDGAF